MKKIIPHHYTLIFLTLLLFSLNSLTLPQFVSGTTFTLNATWSPNSETNIREYRLYRTDVARRLVGTAIHPNTSFGPFSVDVPNDITYGILTFVLTAVNTNNVESTDSNPAYFSYDLRNTVAIVATDNVATEKPLKTGYFTVTRTGSTSDALTVYYTVMGTATPGSDYIALPGSITIPAGSSTTTISITPIDDANVENDETVIVSLSANASYVLGTPNNGTITISSDDVNDVIIESVLFADNFSTDKGWIGYETGGWERRPAVVGGGEIGNPDPANDHSPSPDNYILGFAIGGDYPNNLAEKSIISPPINCQGENQVFLKFWRYFNVGSNYYDHAKVYVSNDRVIWVKLWENPGFDLTDNSWVRVVYDISQVAAHQATVYIKFTMGPTNSSGRYSGLNIDDIEVTSNYSGPLALYVPSGDSPNPNVDEMIIQNGLGIKHSNEIPSDLKNYKALMISRKEACNSTTAGYIRNFVQNGGGVIMMGDTPKFLAGAEFLSSIADWFGAGSFGNDCGYGNVMVNNPLGTDLMINGKLDYALTNTCGAASVYNLNINSKGISQWSGGRIHSFIYKFNQGRVFYYAGEPGFSESSDPEILENGLRLFEAGFLWTANSVFSDILSTHWSYDYITSIYIAALTTGCATDDPNTPQNEQKYCPAGFVTRDQMAAFIIRALEGEPPLDDCESGVPFPDVTSDMWSCRYIKRLKERGITTGYLDGMYWPYDRVPRDHMAAFLVRAVAGEPPLDYCDSGVPFSDVTSDRWSCRYIKRLKELKITTGYGDGTYGPDDLVTRAMMAAFLARAFLGM